MATGRIASLAGWLTLVGILAFEVIGPMVTAGARVSGTTDRARIEAYYANDALLWFGLGAIVVVAVFVVFVSALRGELAQHGDSPWTDVGWACALIAAALLLTRTGLQMALVRGVDSDADVLPLFFAWDFVYNAAVYAMEAVYPLAFALALTSIVGTARWYLGLSMAVAAFQVVNMTSLVVGLPEAATLPGNVAFAAWLGATAWVIGRPHFGAESAAQPVAA
jgi:hypothetical protein